MKIQCTVLCDRRWQRLLAGRKSTPSAKIDDARLKTIPGSCPHVHPVVACLGPDQMALSLETEVPYLYLAGVRAFHENGHDVWFSLALEGMSVIFYLLQVC